MVAQLGQLIERGISTAAVQLGQLVSLRRLAPLGFQFPAQLLRLPFCQLCPVRVVGALQHLHALHQAGRLRPVELRSRRLRSRGRARSCTSSVSRAASSSPLSYCLPSKPALVTRLATSWGVMASSAGTG